MIANYHTHTFRCHHAEGDDEAYVRAAISRGVKILGFSDHTPQFYRNTHVNPNKMLPEDMDDYVTSVLSLKEKYKDVIDIRLGFETEYFPLLWDELLQAYRKYPIDYLILGQHVGGNESTPDSYNAFAPTSDPQRLHAFIDQEIAALQTGRFSCVAHPDVLPFRGDEDLYCEECARLILCAKELDIPLEINLLGLTYGRHYPNPLFWKTAGALGATGIIGCDAHEPERVAVSEEEQNARAFAAEYGVKLLDSMVLRNPLF